MGAGTRLLAYRLDDPPTRLWEDSTEMGFWDWSVHAEAVLMAAEWSSPLGVPLETSSGASSSSLLGSTA